MSPGYQDTKGNGNAVRAFLACRHQMALSGPRLLASLRAQASSQHTRDVTLVCRDGNVRGHRLLLAAASPLLREALGEEVDTVMVPWVGVDVVTQTLGALLQHQPRVGDDVRYLLRCLGVWLGQGQPRVDVKTEEFEDHSYSTRSDYDHGEDLDYFSMNEEDNPIKKDDYDGNSGSFQSHASISSQNSNKLECTECNLTFRSGSLLRHHKCEHLLQCPQCDYNTNLKAHYNKHMTKHKHLAETKMFCCEHCNTSVLDPMEYKLHVETCKDTKSPKKRREADAEAEKLVKVVSEDDAHKHYACTDCDYANPFKWKVVLHAYKHTKILPFNCDLCGKGFRDTRTLNDHIAFQHEGRKPHLCNLCDETYSTKAGLQYHVKVKHHNESGSKVLECDVEGCHYSTKQSASLVAKHKARMHNTNGDTKRHLCNTCGKTFYDKKELKEHDIAIHKEKHLPCSYCDKLYPSEKHREKHENTVHATQLAHQCDQCPQGYRHPSSLHKHILTMHSGEDAKKFKCDHCGKAFITNGKLKAHERIHTGEKRYSCPHCGLRFTDSSAMARHRKTHEGGSKYSCDLCQKSYSQSYDVVKHKAAVHGVGQERKFDHPNKGKKLKRDLKPGRFSEAALGLDLI